MTLLPHSITLVRPSADPSRYFSYLARPLFAAHSRVRSPFTSTLLLLTLSHSGHSSIPPPHTGIGILSSLITTLESTPYSPSLSLSSPIFSLLQCAATHGDLSPKLRESVRKGAKEGKKADRARKEVAERFAEVGRPQRYLVSTSQAVDVMGGGVKGAFCSGVLWGRS